MITGSRAEAEDLAHESFTRVLERWTTVAGMDDPADYLHRTAMNVFRNQYRRARVAMKRAVGLAPEQDVLAAVEDRAVATQVLASLAATGGSSAAHAGDKSLPVSAACQSKPIASNLSIACWIDPWSPRA